MKLPESSTAALLPALFSVGASATGWLQFASDFGVAGRNATYDHIVIGGGTAGLAIAMRLAENTSNSVAIIEASGFYQVNNGNTSIIPRLGQAYDSVTFAAGNSFPTID
jgi:choline dehydrogenase